MNFNRIEKWIFHLLVAAHLFPVFALGFFVTHDGPAHTYNTELLERVFAPKDDPAKKFFGLNPRFQPNWGYNALMLLTDRIFSAVFSEKLIVAFSIVLLAYSFRALMKEIDPANLFLSYFVFPFLFSFHLFMGFFNYCLGAALFFFTLHYFTRNRKGPSFLYYTGIGLLALSLLFTHVFSFLLFCLVACFMLMNDRSGKLLSRMFFQRIGPYLVSLMPALALCIMFLLRRNEGGNTWWRTFPELMRWLYECQPAITMTYGPERIFGLTVSLLTALSVLIAFLYGRKKPGCTHFWLWMSLLVLALYFMLPDGTGTWGFISLRTLMFLFLFLPLWFASYEFPKAWPRLLVLVMTVMLSFRLIYIYGVSRTLSGASAELFSFRDKIRPRSVILPLNYTQNFMHDNIACYLGTVNDNLLLDNYEAAYPHFPLVWKKETDPYALIGDYSGLKLPCADIGNFERITNIKIDYVLRWGYSGQQDSCSRAINKQLADGYALAARSGSGMAELYKRKD